MHLTQKFLLKLSSPTAVHRIYAVQYVIEVCVNSKKPDVFLQYVLSNVLETTFPPQPMQTPPPTDTALHSILGGVHCIAQILAQYRIRTLPSRPGKNSAPCDEPEIFLRVLELCIRLLQTLPGNVSVVITGLECLAELFQLGPRLPPGFVRAVTEANAFATARVFVAGGAGMAGRGATRESLSSFSRSQLSLASSSVRNLHLDEDSSILPEDVLSPVKAEDEGGRTNVESWIEDAFGGSQDAPSQVACHEDDTPSISMDPPSPPPSTIGSEPPLPNPQTHNIGSLWDKDGVALLYCVRYLVTTYLLPHSGTRVGVQTVTLEVLTHMLTLAPQLSLEYVDKDGTEVDGSTNPRILDLLLSFNSDSDPEVRGLCNVLVSHLVESVLEKNVHSDQFDLDLYVGFFVKGIQDESASCIRRTLSGLKHFLPSLLQSSIPLQQFHIPSSTPSSQPEIPSATPLPSEITSCPEKSHIPSSVPSQQTEVPCTSPLPESKTSPSPPQKTDSSSSIPKSTIPSCVPLLQTLLEIFSNDAYWLNQNKRTELLSLLPYETLPASYQRSVLNDIFLRLLTNEDIRIRTVLAKSLEELVEHVYPPHERVEAKMTSRCCYRNGCHGNPRCSKSSNLHGNAESDSFCLLRCFPDESCHENKASLNVICDEEGEGKRESERDAKVVSQRVVETDGTEEEKGVGKDAIEYSSKNNENIAGTKDSVNANIKEGDVMLNVDESANIDNFCDKKNLAGICDGVELTAFDSNSSKCSNNPNFNHATTISSSDRLNLEFETHVDSWKLNYICSRDLSRFEFLDDSLSRFWKNIKLEMFIDMFHNMLNNELRSFENKKHFPNIHVINGCVDLLNKLTELFPIDKYRDVWLQSKYVCSRGGLVALLMKRLFENTGNLDTVAHSAVLTLLVRILCVDGSVESKLSLTLLATHMVRTVTVIANVVGESSKLKTNTLKKNLEKISPIKNFTKDKIQTLASPKALHLPVTSFLAQPILSHVALNVEVLSPLREDDAGIPSIQGSLHEELYSKFYDTVSNAYNNYKNNLEFDTDFSNLLSSLLDNLSCVMQLLTHSESKFLISDLSSSLSIVMNIEPRGSIKCAYYAMKSVFNLEPVARETALDVSNKPGSERPKNEHVTAKGDADKLSENSTATSDLSPYDIFEPSLPNDTGKSPSKLAQSTETVTHEERTRKTVNLRCDDDKEKRRNCGENLSFHENCISKPLDKVKTMIENLNVLPNNTNMSSHKLKKRFATDSEKLLHDFRTRYLIKKTKQLKQLPDAHMLSQYLRLFEPCIIPLFKHYAASSNVTLQVYVLKLLTYLIQLGFNYYNIDPDLAFVQILIKQFELFEHGYIKNSHAVLPSIVKFLLTLCVFGVEKTKANAGSSNTAEKGKKETKLGSGSSLATSKTQDDTVISINKIIHICDELYASGQNLQQHCIPGLKHVVKYIFIESHHPKVAKKESLVSPRVQNSTHLDKDLELDTQQEVLFMNLLKLVHYPEVVFILSQILPENCNGDVYQRRCSDVYTILIRHLEAGTLTLDNFTHIENVLSLLNTLSPNVFEVDTLLSLLFKLTDFNEHNIVSNVACIVLLLVTLFKRYSLEDIYESIVRKKYTSFSLDWNTEVDPLHVSITLDAASVQPEAELARLLLYLLYQTITSYNSLSKQSRSSFVSDLTLHVVLIYEHIIEKYLSLRRNLVLIICEERLKNNNFFCDLGGHFQTEPSALLCAHFTRLTSMLNYLMEDEMRRNRRDENLESYIKVPEEQLNQKSTNQKQLDKQYKVVLNFLVFLDSNSVMNSDPAARILPNDFAQTRLLQFIALQNETPVQRYLLNFLKTNTDACSQILEIFYNDDFVTKRFILSSNTAFIGNFLQFISTYFNLEVFSERILLLVSKCFLNINVHLGYHNTMFVLMSSCCERILSSKTCSVISSSDISGVLSSLFRISAQCELHTEVKKSMEILLRALLDMQVRHFGTNEKLLRTSEFSLGNMNTEEWFLRNVKTLCHLLPLDVASSESSQLSEHAAPSFIDNWETRNHLTHTNLAELLKKLNESEMASIVNHEQFDVKILSSLMSEGKFMLMKNNDGKLLEATAVKMFNSVKALMNLVPKRKMMYNPVHRFSTLEETEFGEELTWAFIQNDVFTRCEILVDVVLEYFKTIDELDVFLEEQSDSCFVNRSPMVRRNTLGKEKNQSSDGRSESRNSSHETVDKAFNPREVVNKLKELNKQNSNEMFEFSLVLFNFLSYLMENRNLLIRNEKNKLDKLVNKIVSTANVLIDKFSFIFNILLKETELDLNNIINSIYQCILYYKDSCFILTKHGNLNLTNSDSVNALFHLNSILQLIIHESEVSIEHAKENVEEFLPAKTESCFSVTLLFNLTLALCKCDSLYTYCRVPLQLWEYIEPIHNLNDLSLASLPTDMLLSVQSLREFILRLKYVGWYSRVHFEQTWVILLKILTDISNEDNEDYALEEKGDLYTLTIQGITELLVQTQLIEPGNRKLVDAREAAHHPRVFSHLNQYQGRYVHSARNKRKVCSQETTSIKHARMNNILFKMNQVTHNALPAPWSSTNVNYELSPNVYNVNQLSHNYLQCLLLENEMNKDYLNEEDNVQVVDITNKDYINHVKKIKLINLDVQSCLHLLIDIYSQLFNDSTLKGDVVESVLLLSDLFDNYQHYEWMFAKFSAHSSEHSDYAQAVSLMCATKALCFIKLEQKKDKLNVILKKIITSLNALGHVKSSSEVLKLASLKSLFYLLENYVERYIEVHAESNTTDVTINVSIADKIKHSHLLNKTLDLIYNLIKTNTVWNSLELETNFTALCLYVLETFQAFTPYCKHAPLIETLNIIVEYLSARLKHYLNSAPHWSLANKLVSHLARLLTIYPEFEYLHRRIMHLCTSLIMKNKNHCEAIYTLFTVCIYSRYYTEDTFLESHMKPNEDTVDRVLIPNLDTIVDDEVKTNLDVTVSKSHSAKDSCDKNVPELDLKQQNESKESTSAIKENSMSGSLENQFIENFFSIEKDTANPKDTGGSSTGNDLEDQTKSDKLLEDDDSFYKMITSKQKSYQIKNFFSDRKEKIKNLIKVKTSFDPLTNMGEKSTFYDKSESDVDESSNVATNEGNKQEATTDELTDTSKDPKHIDAPDDKSKSKFTSYIETDKESTTDDSEKEFPLSTSKLASLKNTNTAISNSSNKINEDMSSTIVNYTTDDSFAMIEIVSLFLSRIKQLNQEEIKVISQRINQGVNEPHENDNIKSNIRNNPNNETNALNQINKDSDKSLNDVFKEVDVLCELIPGIFLDFSLESDMLNRIVSEFLTLSKQNFVQLKKVKEAFNEIRSTKVSTKSAHDHHLFIDERRHDLKPAGNLSFNKSSTLEGIKTDLDDPSGAIDLNSLHVQTKLSHILLHVLKHNQIDLINDWIVSTLSNLFDLNSVQLTRYYLFIFLCFSCTNDLIREYFVHLRRIDSHSLMIVVRTFYNQLKDDSKSKFIEEVRSVAKRVQGSEEVVEKEAFSELFDCLFTCLEAKW